MSRRTEMLGSTIQRELAGMIMRDLSDPRLPTIVSVTRVEVTQDLEFADVFVSVMGTPEQQEEALNALKHSAGLMRMKLTRALSLRQAPFLRFGFDERLKKELEILDLIERARIEREETEARRAAAAEAEGAGGRSEDAATADAAPHAEADVDAGPGAGVQPVPDPPASEPKHEP